MPPGSQAVVGVPPNQMMMGQRAAVPPQRPPMTPEQMGLGQRPGLAMPSNQGAQANQTVMSMVRQPGMIQQPTVVPSGQGMVANQRVCLNSVNFE